MRWMRIGRTAAFLAALAVALGLSLGLWGNWTASAQDTFIVNQDTGTGDPAPCDAPDFPSVSDIETVIDDTDVEDGDKLVLCPGTYTAGAGGTVEVDKELTIEGLAAADRDDIVVQGSDADGFLISVDGATLRHLKLVSAGSDDGIWIEAGVNNNTIQDMEVTDWEDGVIIDHAEGNVVESSKIHSNNEDGVSLIGGANNTVRNNEITGNQLGARISTEDGDLVDGNTVSGNWDEQLRLSGKMNVRVVRNIITAVTDSDGIRVAGTPAESLIVIGGSPDKANTLPGPFWGPEHYGEP